MLDLANVKAFVTMGPTCVIIHGIGGNNLFYKSQPNLAEKKFQIFQEKHFY